MGKSNSNNRTIFEPLSDVNRLVLASASSRRKQLLLQMGIKADSIMPANIDESAFRNESPRLYAARLAKEKCLAISKLEPRAFIIGADTVVTAGTKIFPKADSIEIARECMIQLSGRRHQVITGVAVISPLGRLSTRLVTTRVKFKRLSDKELEVYLGTYEWEGKAGGYAIQGVAGSFIDWINGSYTNVVGLPLYETKNLLEGLGWKWKPAHGKASTKSEF